MNDKIFNFFWFTTDRSLMLFPTINISFEFEYIIIGWLVFGVEIHYDLIYTKK